MKKMEIELLNAYKNLYNMQNQSTADLNQQLNKHQLTMTQINYLRIIDRCGQVTISQLAIEVDNSKPTVTEMVKKFDELEIVEKIQCKQDGRKQYIKLTDKGLKIARIEEYILRELVKAMVSRLSDEDISDLIRIFRKLA